MEFRSVEAVVFVELLSGRLAGLTVLIQGMWEIVEIDQYFERHLSLCDEPELVSTTFRLSASDLLV